MTLFCQLTTTNERQRWKRSNMCTIWPCVCACVCACAIVWTVHASEQIMTMEHNNNDVFVFADFFLTGHVQLQRCPEQRRLMSGRFTSTAQCSKVCCIIKALRSDSRSDKAELLHIDSRSIFFHPKIVLMFSLPCLRPPFPPIFLSEARIPI